jgi:uncharacterized protein (TIGR00255 family)
MTGFGAGESSNGNWTVAVELSGVNRKQLDLSINLPQSVSSFEPEVRKLISSEISRGRINARVSISNQNGRSSELVVDRGLALQLVEAARDLAAVTGLPFSLSTAELLRSPGLIKIEEAELDVAEVKDLLGDAVKLALASLARMQCAEGAHLQQDLEVRISVIEAEIEIVSGLAREVVDKYRETLRSRLSESGLTIDLGDERVLREIALYAEKCDVTEEITRIGSHLGQFRKYFASAELVGRQLDFLCQELNRELNTIGSKSNHAVITQAVVNSKTELEKIREQVQNLQ